MRTNTLIRLGGILAALAGWLRMAGSFVSGAPDAELQALYFMIDVLLLLGALAAYAQQHDALGRWGATGFLVTVVGILLVRSSRALPGIDLYPAGALAVALGWALLTAMWWTRARGSVVPPALFGASILAGAAGQLPGAAALFIVSGVLFGAAVVVVGRQVIVEQGHRARARS